MGAGGNMTVQEINNPSTRKGDPFLMEHHNAAWRAANTPTKKYLRPRVQPDGNGNIVRMDAIEN